jgi:hypothetical protein
MVLSLFYASNCHLRFEMPNNAYFDISQSICQDIEHIVHDFLKSFHFQAKLQVEPIPSPKPVFFKKTNKNNVFNVRQ